MLGDSSMGQLGIGRRSAPNNPTDVSNISKVEKIAVGYFHCLALNGNLSQTNVRSSSYHLRYPIEAGDVYSWGAGSGGKLGTGETSDAVLPVKVSGLKKVKDIAAGKTISAALTSTSLYYLIHVGCDTNFASADGEVYTWGNDKSGALGLKGIVEAFTPQKVDLPEKIATFSLYESHIGAISETGKLYMWGRGTEGTKRHLRRVR